AGNSVKAQKALEYISVRLGLNIFSPARVELAAAEPVREGVCK
ncbi:glutaminase, partial [Escherichia coli]|nr:glutaminase [Escherichia coli]